LAIDSAVAATAGLDFRRGVGESVRRGLATAGAVGVGFAAGDEFAAVGFWDRFPEPPFSAADSPANPSVNCPEFEGFVFFIVGLAILA
jgi:hypothetical protein